MRTGGSGSDDSSSSRSSVGERVLDLLHVRPALGVDDGDVRTVERVVDAPAAARDAVRAVVERPQDPVVGLQVRVDLALVPDVVARGDHVDAGAEDRVGRGRRQAHPAGDVLAVRGDEVDPALLAQPRQHLLDGHATRLADHVADHQHAAAPPAAAARRRSAGCRDAYDRSRDRSMVVRRVGTRANDTWGPWEPDYPLSVRPRSQDRCASCSRSSLRSFSSGASWRCRPPRPIRRRPGASDSSAARRRPGRSATLPPVPSAPARSDDRHVGRDVPRSRSVPACGTRPAARRSATSRCMSRT